MRIEITHLIKCPSKYARCSHNTKSREGELTKIHETTENKFYIETCDHYCTGYDSSSEKSELLEVPSAEARKLI